jgi:hypothetical protein
MWRREPPAPRDAGAVAPALPLFAMAILLLGGLVVDAARQLDARAQAVAYAEEAARAGASAIELGDQTLTLQPGLALERARLYCAGLDPRVTCSGYAIEPVGPGDPRPLVVRVHTDITIPATLLGIVGVTELHASGDGRARPLDGVTGNDAG